jgi:predicted nucleotidyltransferase
LTQALTQPAEARTAPLYTGDTVENIACGNMYHQEIARLIAKIVDAEHPEKIVLFGSYARGTATETSDVDLLVISRSAVTRREREVHLTRQLFGSGVPYDLLVLTPEEIEERLRRSGPFIQEILSTGRVIYERP